MNNKQTESKNLSPQFLRKRKMMLVMPLLVLPFITMVFWALGGGSVNKPETTGTASSLNLQLPSAHLKNDNSETKLSYYEEAEKDSVRMGTDAGTYLFPTSSDARDSLSFHLKPAGSGLSDNSILAGNYKDANEEKVYQKLAELNQQLSVSPARNYEKSEPGNYPDKNMPAINTNEVEKLDQLMKNMNKNDGADDDPEIRNLNGLMDKILDIQHPNRVNEQTEIKEPQNNEFIFPVKSEPILSSVSLLDTSFKKQTDNNRFFGIDEEENNKEQNAIEAVVHDNQILVNGSVIKLRLVNNISVNGNVIPKNNFVFGTVSLNGERLHVEVISIKKEQSLFPVKLIAYDMDGLPGIYIPGAITRDVAKESANNAAQMLETSSIDPSLKAQATTAGINAMKNLLSKKVKLISVTVKAGYKILLK